MRDGDGKVEGVGVRDGDGEVGGVGMGESDTKEIRIVEEVKKVGGPGPTAMNGEGARLTGVVS